MSHISYVKMKGTCATCRGKDKKNGTFTSHIEEGALFWTRDGKDFPSKFHFECYAPKFGKKWAAEKLSPEFLAEVELLKTEDQVRVLSCFEGQQEAIAAITGVPASAEPAAVVSKVEGPTKTAGRKRKADSSAASTIEPTVEGKGKGKAERAKPAKKKKRSTEESAKGRPIEESAVA